jgi:hypothetical protein
MAYQYADYNPNWNPWSSGQQWLTGTRPVGPQQQAAQTYADASMYGADQGLRGSLAQTQGSMWNTDRSARANEYGSNLGALASMYGSNLGATANMYGSDRGLQGILASLPWNYAGQQLAADASRDASRWGAYGSIFGGYYPAQANMYGANQAAGASMFGSGMGALASMYGSNQAADASRYGSGMGAMSNMYGADRAADASMYGSGVGALSNMYGADTAARANMYGSGMGAMASMYGSDAAERTGLGTAQIGADASRDVERMRTGLGYYNADVGLQGLLAQITGQKDIAGMEGQTARDVAQYGLQGTIASAAIPAQSALQLAQMEQSFKAATLAKMLGLVAPLLSSAPPAMPSIGTNYGAGVSAR